MDIYSWQKVAQQARGAASCAAGLMFRQKWFSALISIFLTGLIFVYVDVSQILATIAEVHLRDYLVGLGLILVYLGVRAKRWQVLLRSQQVVCPVGRVFAAYNIGSLYGLLTPGRVGDFIKAYHVSGPGGSTLNALWATAYDRLLDVIVLLGLNVAAIFLLKDLVMQFQQQLLLLGITLVLSTVIALVILVGVLATKGKLFTAHSRAGSAFPSRWAFQLNQKVVEPLVRLLSIPAGDRSVIILMTVLMWALLFGAYYTFALALEIYLPPGLYVGITAVSMLASSLPISFSGIGVRDLSLLLLLSRHGVDEHRALGLAWLVLSTYLLSALIGAFALFFQSPGRRLPWFKAKRA